ESAQDAGRRPDRRRVGGEGDGAQAALLPHHEEGTRGAEGKGASVDRALSGGQPHPGEIRWTNLSITSIASVEASVGRGRCARIFDRDCASICWMPLPSTRRPVCRRNKRWIGR